MGLSHNHARQLIDQAKVFAHLKTLEKCVHVAKVATGDDDVVWNLPIKLLENFDRRSLLALKAKGVKRIRQVDG